MTNNGQKPCDTLKIESDLSTQEGVAMLRLTGVLDAHTFDQLEENFEDLFAKGVLRLIVDMRGVTYASSAGIGVFIGALAKARQQHGDLLLMNLNPDVREVFELLGLLNMFFIAPDRSTAIAYFIRTGATATALPKR